MTKRVKRTVKIRGVVLPWDWWKDPWAYDLSIGDVDVAFASMISDPVVVARIRERGNRTKTFRHRDFIRGRKRTLVGAKRYERTMRLRGWQLTLAICTSMEPGKWYSRREIADRSQMGFDGVKARLGVLVGEGVLVRCYKALKGRKYRKHERRGLYRLTERGEMIREGGALAIGKGATDDRPLGVC